MSTHREQQLFVAVDAIQLSCVHRGHEGWSLSFATRRHGEPWGPQCWTHYSGLSTRELVDVMQEELDRAL